MQGIVGLDKALLNLADELETEGYEGVILDDSNINIVDAIIVGNTDLNLLNIQDTAIDVPVINATGKTFNEIVEELEMM